MIVTSTVSSRTAIFPAPAPSTVNARGEKRHTELVLAPLRDEAIRLLLAMEGESMADSSTARSALDVLREMTYCEIAGRRVEGGVELTFTLSDDLFSDYLRIGSRGHYVRGARHQS